jgi:WD40 repeat protein
VDVIPGQGEATQITALCVTASSGQAVTGSADGQLTVWNLARRQQPRSLRASNAAIYELAVSSEGRIAVFQSPERVLRVIELETGREQGCVMVDGHVLSVAIGPDDRSILAGDASAKLYCWRYHPPQRP